MRLTSRWLYRVERALLLSGVSLLAIASAAAVSRWTYQSQEERALFERGPAAAVVERVIAPEVRSDQSVVETKTHHPARRPDALGRIEIPRLGVKAIIREGADERTLLRAVGLVPGSARPGDPGNVVLAGHRDTFFRRLRRIEPGDAIRIRVPPHTYEYRVQSVRVVEPTETDVLQSRGVEELTLVTCYPFPFIGPAPQRFIVNAARLSGKSGGPNRSATFQ